jgi:hypothetical protein
MVVRVHIFGGELFIGNMITCNKCFILFTFSYVCMLIGLASQVGVWAIVHQPLTPYLVNKTTT